MIILITSWGHLFLLFLMFYLLVSSCCSMYTSGEFPVSFYTALFPCITMHSYYMQYFKHSNFFCTFREVSLAVVIIGRLLCTCRVVIPVAANQTWWTIQECEDDGIHSAVIIRTISCIVHIIFWCPSLQIVDIVSLWNKCLNSYRLFSWLWEFSRGSAEM